MTLRPPFTYDQRLPTPPGAPHPYPYVGPNYMELGEQPGQIYDYRIDRYRADPAAQQEVLRSQGVLPPEPPPPPKPPGLMTQIAPVVGTALAVEGGKYIGGKIPGLVSEVTGLLGLGGASGASTAVTSAGRGLAGLGGPAQSALANYSMTGAGTGTAANVVAPVEGGGLLEGLGSLSNYLTPVAGVLGTYGMYRTLKDTGQYKASGREKLGATLQGAASGGGMGLAAGAAMGATLGPVGALIGAGVGGLIGLGKSVFGSGKGENQALRDIIRKSWRNLGILDDNMEYKGFDVDQDGKKRLSDGRRIYEIGAGQEKGTGDPFAGEQGAVRGGIVADINPLNVIIFGGNKKAQGYGTGMMFNMLYETSGGKISKKDVFEMYKKTFSSQAQALASIDELIKKEKISPEDGAVYKGNVSRLYAEMSSGKYEDYKIDPTAPLSTPIGNNQSSNEKLRTELPVTESKKVLSEEELGTLPGTPYRDNIDLPSGEIPTTPIASQQLPNQAVQGVPVASSVRQVLSPEEQKRLMEEAMRRLRSI